MTYQEGLALATKYSLEEEYKECINNGDSPEEALQEWDIL